MNQKRGLFLVSALLISFVIALFLSAGLRLSMGNLKASDTKGQQALFAAESGLRYVQSRMASDYGWTADGGQVVNTQDMVVEEHDGNIIGIIRCKDGTFAQFRVRFNHQDDGVGNADGMPDPGNFWIDSPYVSVKNLLGGSKRPVPRADGPNFSVTPTSATPYDVPPGSNCVIVEGRSGPGLSSLSATNLNPTPSGHVSTRVVECYLEGANIPGADAAAMAAGDIDFDLYANKAVTLSAKDKKQVSRIRSRGQIEVTGGASTNLVSENGETYTQNGSLGANASQNVTAMKEDPLSSFYRLGWNDVKKAPPTADTLAAGTYVVWDNGDLHYYDMDLGTYNAHILTNPTDGGTVVTSLPSAISYNNDGNKPKFTITDNLQVSTTAGGTNELNIIPRAGAQEDPPTVVKGELVSRLSQQLIQPQPTQPTQGTQPTPVPGVIGPQPTQQPQMQLSQLQAQSVYQLQAQLTPALWNVLPMQQLSLPSVSPQLRPDDLTIEFKPPAGQSAIVSATGTVRFGANVKGEGGSITSEKDIKLVGNGTQLSASLADGLTLYAKENVVLSSLQDKGNNKWDYKDIKIKGVIYSWGDIEVKTAESDPGVNKQGKFELEGTMVAYGGDPAGNPGTNGDGKIEVQANEASLKFDPAYLLQLTTAPPPGPLKQTLYNVY